MIAPVRIRYWEAGGLHVHISHPDGSWERRTFPRAEWWQVDAVIRNIKQIYAEMEVQVDG